MDFTVLQLQRDIVVGLDAGKLLVIFNISITYSLILFPLFPAEL